MLPERQIRMDWARVLVVEDEVLVRALLAEELREAGCTVVEAANADEALAWLQSGATVDLVFSDVLMPGSMNGLDLARRIAESWPGLPVILSSGYIGGRTLDGRAIFLPKPYDIGRAVRLVLAQLHRRRAGGA